MYDLELLRKFCIVAKHASFTKASEELFISQPALSKSIKKLEEQMGLKLFERTTKSVILTKEGSMLYHLIYPNMEYICNIDNFLNSLKNKGKEKLRIGCNATITRNVLIPALKDFLASNENINLYIKNKSTYDLVNLLLNKELDMLIVNLPIQNISGLNITDLMQVQDVFIANEKYSYLKDQPITLEELKTLPIIMNSKGSVTREYFDEYCGKNNISITPHIETVRSSLLIDFCVLGLGISLTTYEFMKKEIEDNNLNILNLQPAIPKRSIGIITRNEPKTNVINEVINCLKRRQSTN